MENYKTFEQGFFDITHDEIKSLEPVSITRNNYEDVALYFKEQGGKNIEQYWLYKIPKHMKRNNWDNASLIVVQLTNGSLIAKRHNNSQHLKVS